MNFLDVLQPAGVTQQGRINGVVVGIVSANKDPDGLGRVRLTFPWLNNEDESAWARIAAPMAGKDRGLFALPEIKDEVLVAFEHGDPRFPYVIGFLWNGKDTPPDNAANDVRVIKSRSGHVIRLTDTDEGEKIEIIDKKGNSIVLDSSADKILISAKNGTIRLEAMNVEISATKTAELKGGMVNIN